MAVKRNFRSYSPAFNFSTPADRKRTNTVPLLSQASGNVNRDIFRAASETLIDQISIAVSVALVADSNNFWTLDVKLISAASAGTVTRSILTTPLIMTAALAANTNLDLGVAANTVIGPNDVLQLQISKTANPADLEDLVAFLDYEVTGITTTTSSSTTTTTSTTTSSTTSTSSTSTTTISTTTTLT